MKKALFALLIIVSYCTSAQADERITTLQFVQVVDDRWDEALYYYKSNWKELREKAVDQNIITSYEFIRTERTEDYPIDIILITTYKDENQFQKREENFGKIMEGRELNLLNEFEPGEFRKTIFVKEKSTHSFQ
jgi:hypothetical protein